MAILSNGNIYNSVPSYLYFKIWNISWYVVTAVFKNKIFFELQLQFLPGFISQNFPPSLINTDGLKNLSVT